LKKRNHRKEKGKRKSKLRGKGRGKTGKRMQIGTTCMKGNGR